MATQTPQRLDGWHLAAVHRIKPRPDELPAGCPCWNCGEWCGWTVDPDADPDADEFTPCARVALRSPHEPETIGIGRIICAPCARVALVARYGDPAAVPLAVQRLAGWLD